ncbi:hypothetical protein HHL22_00360 [Hymenobacter sp. RP-2-7]|uniref:Glycosyl transferase n=1 Tax=Hymenobacter polaris TaxID=2682546 RepID=A0A7Y0AAA0_9BACT|nr:hypothetical protein [Hymenobacter polaris]NML63652.1 hypothetical protein [Hymenobacter polaris]
MKRGIYIVANKKSEQLCKNLIYSIRESGCNLPIRLIHFGGKQISSSYILNQVELLNYSDFSDEAKDFITNLRSVLVECPMGFLYRYLAWFSDWDEFIYSDNDIVALCNWEILFSYLNKYELVHADEEYTTNGLYNYNRPESVKEIFGELSLLSAVTAGHLVVKRNEKMIIDIKNAIEWFKNNPDIPKKHDQSLLHVATLLGSWNILNLCKPPHNWLSSWAGDYKNSLHLVQSIQLNDSRISHIHYSGGSPKGNLPIQDLLFSADSERNRLIKLAFICLRFLSKFESFSFQISRIKRFLKVKKI